jgi:hypothetical protein
LRKLDQVTIVPVRLKKEFNKMASPNTDNMGKLFVTLFAFVPALKTNLYWLLHPDTRICTQLKPCTLTNFWLRDNLYRDTAPVPAINFVTGDKFAAPITIVPRHTQCSIKFCTRTAKSAPYPPCTVTTSWLKYQDPARMLRRVTQPPHIAGPLCVIHSN